jgi:hypothetical protein
MVYWYSVYTLTFQSTLSLPELTPTTAPPTDAATITIDDGQVPHSLSDARIRADLYEMNGSHLLYHVPGVARYLIEDGRTITIARTPHADEDSVRLFLLGVVLACALQQRRMYALRASALETANGAILLAGMSGAGKSTLTGALIQRGWRLLSDDLSVIALKNGQIHVLPGYPLLRLWGASLRLLKIDRDGLSRVRPAVEKYVLPLDSKSFCGESRPLQAIYCLSLATQETDRFIPLDDPPIRMAALHKQLHPQRIAIDFGNLPFFWPLTLAALEAAHFFRIERVAQRDNLMELTERVEANIK